MYLYTEHFVLSTMKFENNTLDFVSFLPESSLVPFNISLKISEINYDSPE